MKIGQHISNIRGLIKLYSRTQEGYTDEGLYNLFSVCRSTILADRLKKFMALSESNWYSICVKLEVSKSHNCDCVPEGLDCKVLKTVNSIPNVLVGRNSSKIKLRTIGGKVINLVTEDQWFRKKDLETNSYYASLVNGHIILWNVPLSLKVLLISGIWSDPVELSIIPNCSGNGTVIGQCFDPLTSEFPLQQEYAEAVYKMVLGLLSIPLQSPQDQTNDSNEFVKM
jgi:hypothetical protein